MSGLLRILLAVACLRVSLPGQTPDFSSLDRAAIAELAKSNIPGASIAIVRGQTIVYSKSFGTANIETGEAVRPEMLFRIGSTTKMFTAAALVGLAVEGKFDLNAPLGAYLKFLPPKLSRITAHQLLTHTAGIRDDAPMYGPHDDSALGDGIRAWTDDWLFTSPGKIFSYSSPGYWLAGYLVETLTSKPYADAMDVRIFKPLGMSRTTLRPTKAMTWPLAQGHEAPAGKLEVVRPAADNAATWPAGSIFSNTHDLAQFVIAFLNNGRLDGKQVLDPKVIALMSAGHAAIPGESFRYTYGLGAGEIRGVPVLSHGGSRIGYASDIRMMPSQHAAVIVLTDRSIALPATMDKAMELLAPMEPSPLKSEPSLPITSDEATRVTGVYRNGDQRIEITAHGNRLFLKLGNSPEAELIKHSASSFATASMEFTVIADADGKTEFVHTGARAFARVR